MALERLGKAEAVPTLKALLADTDVEIRDAARRALQENTAPEAVVALRDALATASDADFKLGLINALGWRKMPLRSRPSSPP